MIAERISAGAEELGLTLPDGAADRLERYLQLLEKWNRVYNLTAVRRKNDMVATHVLDSLAISPFVNPGRLLDVGAGAGLPSIPLALTRPDLQVMALDAAEKRAIFLRQAGTELGIRNLEVCQQRIEDYRPPLAFDAAVSRAFSEIGRFAALTHRVVRAGGRLLAMKGKWSGGEDARLPQGVRLVGAHRLVVPGVGGERHLVEMEVE